jgi:hypothetical protein
MVYVAGYTFGRFWIELMRSDPATRVFGDIRINVVVSAVVFVGALVYLAIERRPREALPAQAAATPVPVSAGKDPGASGAAPAVASEGSVKPSEGASEGPG